MKRKLILRLPPKNKILIYCQIVWVLIMLWLRDVVGLPSFISYLTDVIAVSVLVLNMNRIKRGVRMAKPIAQRKIVVAMLICIVIGLALHLVNPLLVLWAARNNLRFYLFFFMCIGLLDVWDIDNILRLLRKFFWANVMMCTFQYFVMGYSQDHLGGFFGIVEGCNAYLNILCCIVISNALADYFAGKMKMGKVIVYLGACLYLALLAELKVFYIELVVMVIVAVLVLKPSFKTVVLCILGVFGLAFAVVLLAKYDPETLAIFLDMDAMYKYLAGKGYTSAGDLNRLTAISQIQARFFKLNPIDTLFGFGFGSCETSQFSFLQSEFARKYGYLHYRWFTHAWIYIEQGFLGLCLLILFFCSLFYAAHQMMRTARRDLAFTALIFTASCFVGIVYNCALQLEACYFIAFMVSIPFVLRKTNHELRRTQK